MIYNLGSGAAAPKLTNIAVTTQPITTIYNEGETFNTAGMVVTAYFDDGSNAVVTAYTCSPTTVPAGSINNSITISYTHGEITKTATVAVVGRRWLFVNGDTCSWVTGGWQGRGVRAAWADGGYSATAPTVTMETGGIAAEHKLWAESRHGVLETVWDIDLSPFRTIVANFTYITTSSGYPGIGLAFGQRNSSQRVDYGWTDISSPSGSTKQNVEFTLDISGASGTHDVYLTFQTDKAWDSQSVMSKAVMYYMYLI